MLISIYYVSKTQKLLILILLQLELNGFFCLFPEETSLAEKHYTPF